MRRLIVPLVFLVLLAGAEGMARYAARSVPPPTLWDNQWTQAKSDQISGLAGEIQVVFAGSSLVQANVNATLFAELTNSVSTAYNAGLPAVGPRVWREFLRDTVYAESCPSLVVIGVGLRTFNDNIPDNDNELYRYLGSRGRLEAVGGEDFWGSVETWLDSNFALFKIRARLREPDKVLGWLWSIGDRPDWRNAALSPDGRFLGFESRTHLDPEGQIEVLREGAFIDLSFGGEVTAAVRQMIEDAIEIGATPVLVEMPGMIEDQTRALPNGGDDLAWFREVLADVAAEYDVVLLSVPELNNKPEFYADSYHMNGSGSEAFTRSLAEQIAQLQLEFRSASCAGSS